MKHIMNPVACWEIGTVHLFARTWIVKRCAQSGHEGNSTFNVSTEDESWIHLAEAFASEVSVTALCLLGAPALSLERPQLVSENKQRGQV